MKNEEKNQHTKLSETVGNLRRTYLRLTVFTVIGECQTSAMAVSITACCIQHLADQSDSRIQQHCAINGK